MALLWIFIILATSTTAVYAWIHIYYTLFICSKIIIFVFLPNLIQVDLIFNPWHPCTCRCTEIQIKRREEGQGTYQRRASGGSWSCLSQSATTSKEFRGLLNLYKSNDWERHALVVSYCLFFPRYVFYSVFFSGLLWKWI